MTELHKQSDSGEVLSFEAFCKKEHSNFLHNLKQFRMWKAINEVNLKYVNYLQSSQVSSELFEFVKVFNHEYSGKEWSIDSFMTAWKNWTADKLQPLSNNI